MLLGPAIQGTEVVSSSPGAMILSASAMVMQLQLDVAKFPAPAVALWELVGERQQRAAIVQLSALIACAVVGEAVGGELASFPGAGESGGRGD